MFRLLNQRYNDIRVDLISEREEEEDWRRLERAAKDGKGSTERTGSTAKSASAAQEDL